VGTRAGGEESHSARIVPDHAHGGKRWVESVTVPEERGAAEPSVIARLAAQQEQRFVPRGRTMPSRLAGWALIVLIGALVVLAAVEVRPW
jgi:hypothetical protein